MEVDTVIMRKYRKLKGGTEHVLISTKLPLSHQTWRVSHGHP